MSTLTIKQIPDQLHDALRREAISYGCSLNSLVIRALSEHATAAARRQQMRKAGADLEHFVKTLPRSCNSLELLRKSRNER